MKKINKSVEADELTEFAQSFPDANWEPEFRDHNGGNNYRHIKQRIFSEQSYLCAYCEIKISEEKPQKQRVEHFHAKSDKTNPDKNWALDWQNIFGVCLGGNDANTEQHPLPENLSCDASKSRLIDNKRPYIPCEGKILNPLSLNASSNLFEFEKATGKIQPDITVCEATVIALNQFETTYALIENTIAVLNLNCDRLVQQRLKVFYSYQSIIKKARINNDKQWKTKLAEQWFDLPWKAFFTTRRCLLADVAEKQLEKIGYNG